MNIHIKEMEGKKQNETLDTIVHKVDGMATLRKELMGHWNGIKQKMFDINHNHVERTTLTGTESRLTNECTPPQFDKNYYEEQFHFLRNQLKKTDDMLDGYYKTEYFVKQINRLERKREELVEMIKDTLIEMKKAIRREPKQCANCKISRNKPVFNPIYSMEVFMREESDRKRRIGDRMVFPDNKILEISRLQLKKMLSEENETTFKIAAGQNAQKVKVNANGMPPSKVEILETSRLQPKNNLTNEKVSKTEAVAEPNKQNVQNITNRTVLANKETFETLQLKNALAEKKYIEPENVTQQITQENHFNPLVGKGNERKISKQIAEKPTKSNENVRSKIAIEQNVQLNPKPKEENGTEISNEKAEVSSKINPKAKSPIAKEEKVAIERKDDLVTEEMKKEIKELQKQLLKEKKIIVKANEKNVELQNSLIETEKAHQGHLEDLKKERDGFLSAFKEKQEEEERKVEEIVKSLIKDHKKQQSELDNFRVELEREKSTMKNEILKERQRNKEIVEQKNELARELFKLKEKMKMPLTEQKNIGLNEMNPWPQKEQQLPSTVKQTEVILRTNSKNKKTRKKNR